MNFNTICALATARMNCAIHIIRVSGIDAFMIVNKILDKPVEKKGFVIWKRNIIDNNKIVDEVLINTFVGPKSYTGEDVIEINCHGGVVLADYIINLLIKYGATYATKGEFSKRALINKKIDVSQVEAINNLVNSNNNISIFGSTNALIGNTTKKINDFQHKLFMLIGQIEVNIDYPEYDDVPLITNKDALKITKKLLNEINQLLINSKRFIPLNEGIKTLIIGNPNVGKSSLLNELTQSEKAIVSNISGTTRDIIESSINLDGITLKLYDTAGIRETNNQIEQIGIKKALSLIDVSDLILLLIPINEYHNKLDEVFENIIKNKNCIVVYTKSDLISKQEINNIKLKDNEVIISTKNHNIANLIKKIKYIFEFNEFINSDMNVLQSNRQIGILENTKYHLENALKSLQNNDPLDLVIYNYEQANINLTKILGNGNEYDFLDELFKNFCIGK